MLRTRAASLILLVIGVIVAGIGMLLPSANVTVLIAGFAIAGAGEACLWSCSRLRTRPRPVRG